MKTRVFTRARGEVVGCSISLAVATGILASCGHGRKESACEEKYGVGETTTPRTGVVRAGFQVAQPPEWVATEAPLLTDHVQVTSRQRFVRAGESYFNADASWIIFQAVPVPANAGQDPSPFYAMYVARLVRDGSGRIVGTDEPFEVSPPMSANTCGWFHPTEPGRILYASTIGEPASDERAGFQVGTNRYRWSFPAEMEIVTQAVRPMVLTFDAATRAMCGNDYLASPVFSREGYDAECSYDPSGRFILYANVDPAKTSQGGRADADIYIFDTRTGRHHTIVKAPGYDGGPFFSPDGRSICYRSDRAGNDLLQIFIADLRFEKGPDGVPVPVGIEREYQVTDNKAVNWAPYWHPSGRYLVYGTSEIGHTNYEVFAVEIDRDLLARGRASDLRRRRITHAAGADVLPVFSHDGSLMMWTSQRGPAVEGEERPSSQVWIARWSGSPLEREWRE